MFSYMAILRALLRGGLMSNSDKEECGDDNWVDIALFHDCVDVACQIVPDCAKLCQAASKPGR